MGRETQGSQAGEQKLERYGVWVKVEPREVTDLPEPEGSFELSDLESGTSETPSGQSREGSLTVEEEKLLDELDTELGPSEGSPGLSIPDEEPLLADDDELPDISAVEEPAENLEGASIDDVEELPELELEEETLEPAQSEPRARDTAQDSAEIEVPLSDSGSQERFEDLDALEDELATAASAAAEPRGASSEILTRIEEELRSIRTDLTELRSELSGLKKAGAEAAPEAPRAGAEAQTGFFDEDEDETIALTGDELDNILNTAEITEETAEVPSVEEPEPVLEIAEEAATPAEELLELESPLPEMEAEASQEIVTEAEELPAELVLDDLPSEPAAKTDAMDLEVLPALDLEGIPEIEIAPAAADAAGAENVEELETLELEEEPSDVEAVAETPLDLDLELVTEAEPVEESVPAPEELAGDVDLEALAAEAEALQTGTTGSPADELDLAELEAVGEETEKPVAAGEEIEIEFEGETGTPAADTDEALLEPLEELAGVEEVPADMAAALSSAQPKEGAAAIPEDLKDEIRTVLKYMDHLLEALPDEKIQEFASSDYFVMYKKLFEDLGLGE